MIGSTHRRHLYLAGFMGTGKSAVGDDLAGQLGVPFIDLDQYIEELCCRPIVDIFRDGGEECFRQIEWRALRLLVGRPPAVIALGGGAPTVPGISSIVRATGRAILLTGDLQTLWDRLRETLDHRPLLASLTGSDKCSHNEQYQRFVTQAETLLARRRDAYAALTDWTVDTSGLTVGQVSQCVIELISVPDSGR
jgi:shikimate kinase